MNLSQKSNLIDKAICQLSGVRFRPRPKLNDESTALPSASLEIIVSYVLAIREIGFAVPCNIVAFVNRLLLVMLNIFVPLYSEEKSWPAGRDLSGHRFLQ